MKQENKVWVVVKEMSVHYDDFFTLQVYSSLELAKQVFDLWVEEDLMNYDAEIEIAHKKVKYYMSDLIYEFEKLDKWNEAEELRGQLIFLTRESGTEFGPTEDPRITYYKGSEEPDRWLVDFDKYAEFCQDKDKLYNLPHYDYLFNHNDYDDFQIFFLQEK